MLIQLIKQRPLRSKGKHKHPLDIVFGLAAIPTAQKVSG